MSMSGLPWQRIAVSGDEYVVVLDEANKAHIDARLREHLLTIGVVTPGTPASGIVRAIRTVALPYGNETLNEDPAAEWSCEILSPEGKRIGTSGNGVRALVDALVRWELLGFEDRRDAIPVGTQDGIRDVLSGRTGYAVDLGRWRMIDAPDIEDGSWRVRIGSEHVTVTESGTGFLTAVSVPTRLRVCVQHSTPRIERGVAHIDIDLCDEEHPGRMSSGVGAAAAALVLRHIAPPDTPHHWAVHAPGGDIAVRMFPTEDGEHVSVSGPVTLVALG